MLSQTPSTLATSSSRRSFLGLRLSRASVLSFASVNTILPQYNAVDDSSFDDESLRSPPIDSFTETPPRYSRINPRNSILLTNPIPVEVARGSPDLEILHKFKYSYPIKSDKPWAILHLYTRDADPGNPRPLKSRPKVPRLWGCDPVVGMLELELDGPQTIQHIKIMIKGKISTSSLGGGSLPFMNHEFTIWDKTTGDPLQESKGEGSSKGIYEGKFAGQHTFPFSFPFPAYVDSTAEPAILQAEDAVAPYPPPSSPNPLNTLPPPSPRLETEIFHSVSSSDARKSRRTSANKPGISFFWSSSRPQPSRTENSDTTASPIPQTFMEKGITVAVTYEISVIIVHGRFKSDSRIKTNISYVSGLLPLPASLKRRQAYEAGALIPGPMNDPDGWSALPTATIHGIFDYYGAKRQIQISYTLYLAQPLSYTRGSVIPCFLTCSCGDAVVLQYLSASRTPIVRLVRRVQHYVRDPFEERKGMGAGLASEHPLVDPGTMAHCKSSDLKTMTHEVATATWWSPPKDVPQQASIRHLEGEIHLSPDLQPSCCCKIFLIEYFAELLPPESVYFEPDLRLSSPRVQGRVVASLPVDITTLHRRDEPIPTAFSKPSITKVRQIFSDTLLEQSEYE